MAALLVAKVPVSRAALQLVHELIRQLGRPAPRGVVSQVPVIMVDVVIPVLKELVRPSYLCVWAECLAKVYELLRGGLAVAVTQDYAEDGEHASPQSRGILAELYTRHI